jgi:hypothetical protein
MTTTQSPHQVHNHNHTHHNHSHHNTNTTREPPARESFTFIYEPHSVSGCFYSTITLLCYYIIKITKIAIHFVYLNAFWQHIDCMDTYTWFNAILNIYNNIIQVYLKFDKLKIYFQQMMVVVSAKECYVFALSDSEKSAIHTDAGIRAVEVSFICLFKLT